MADTVFSLESLKELLSTLSGDAKNTLETFISKLEKTGQQSITLAESFSKIGPVLTEQLVKLKHIGESFSSVFEKAGEGIDFLIDQYKNLGEESKINGAKTVLGLEPLLNFLPKTAAAFGSLADVGNTSGTKISKTFADIEPILGKAFANSRMGILAKSMMEGADSANALENNIISMAASSGDLNSVLGDGNDITGSLNIEYASLVEMTHNVADATNHTIGETMNFAKALSIIPGALRETISVTEDLGSSMNELDASLKLASSYGLEHSKVVENLNTMYRTFGTTGDSAFQALNSIYKTAQEIKMPLDLVTNTVNQMASSFNMLGDNTQAATNVLKTYGKAFQESGLGPDAITKLTQSMVSGIKTMSEGKKAFISSQTGGPGGLAGGFQMDLAIQEGKMDQVLAKTMEAMQRTIGGPILSLKEAGQNENSAGEFQKQVKYLTDIAGVAGNKEEAYRILEAMKKGTTKELALGKREGKDDLSTALQRGTEFQAKGNTELTKISNTLESQKLIQAHTQVEAIRQTIGIHNLVSQGMSTASRKAAGGGAIGMAHGTIPGDMKRSSIDDIIKDDYDRMRGALSSVKGVVNNIKPSEKKTEESVEIEEVKEIASPLKKSKSAKPIHLPPVTELPPPKIGRYAESSAMNKMAPVDVNLHHQPLDLNITIDIPELDAKIKKTTREVIKDSGKDRSDIRKIQGVPHK